MKHDWEYKRLGEVASYINGFAFKPEQWTSDGVPIIRIQNLNNPDAPFNYYDGIVPEKVKVENGDLLISWSATLGTYIWQRGDAYLNQHIFKVEFDKGDIDKMYLKYAVSSKLDAMSNLVHGATMKHIVKRDFNNTIIPVPPKEVQEQICLQLDRINRVIEAKKEQLKELDNLAQAIFYEMFGDPIENPKSWEVKKFEQCIEKVKYTKKIQTTDFLIEGEFPIISQEECFISGYWNDANDVFKVTKPVVIFGDHTRIIKYVNFDFVLGADGVRIFLPKEFLIARYLQWFLKTYRIPNLGYSRHYKLVKEIYVALPPLSLQQAFAEKVEAIERQKDLINQSLRETQTLFDSRMDYWFN